MPLTRLIVLCLFPCLLLPSCGSQTPEEKARSAVSDLSAAIHAYNDSRPSSSSATRSSCAAALDQLGSGPNLQHFSWPARHRLPGQAVGRAYGLAISGFTHCVQGIDALNFPVELQASQEIAEANVWLARARSLDRS